MEYTVIRAKRKSFAIQIKNGEVILRVPMKAKEQDILAVLEKHKSWIEKQLEKERELSETIQKLTESEIKALAEQAKKLLPPKVEYYAKIIGVTYGRITVRNQKTRWGSCSGKGNLNFNCLLMLTPDEVIDSVIVHELCHRKEMNHSPKFYALVEKAFPEYKKWNKWLKTYGRQIMDRNI